MTNDEMKDAIAELSGEVSYYKATCDHHKLAEKVAKIEASRLRACVRTYQDFINQGTEYVTDRLRPDGRLRNEEFVSKMVKLFDGPLRRACDELACIALGDEDDE